MGSTENRYRQSCLLTQEWKAPRKLIIVNTAYPNRETCDLCYDIMAYVCKFFPSGRPSTRVQIYSNSKLHVHLDVLWLK